MRLIMWTGAPGNPYFIRIKMNAGHGQGMSKSSHWRTRRQVGLHALQHELSLYKIVRLPNNLGMSSISSFKKNLVLLLNYPLQNFGLKGDGQTLALNGDPDLRVPGIINKTIKTAIELEQTPNRLWFLCKDGNEYSLGHVLKAFPHYYSNALKDESRRYITLNINGIEYKHLDLHSLKMSSTTLKNLFEDLDDVSKPIPVAIENVSDESICMVLSYLQGNCFNLQIFNEPCLEIVRIANFLGAQSLYNLCLRLIKIELYSNEQLLALPNELIEPILKHTFESSYEETKRKIKSIIQSLPEESPIVYFLINRGLVTPSDFGSVSNFIAARDPKKIERLDLESYQADQKMYDHLQDILKDLSNLKHLSLSWFTCELFKSSQGPAPDFLKYLSYVQKLESLTVCSYENHVEPDALRHLKHTPHLLYLSVNSPLLAPESLKHLCFITNLRVLKISGCKQLKGGSLQFLKYVPNLEELDIGVCQQFAQDELQHLHYVPKLKSLSINGCKNLEQDALKHMINTPKLEKLSLNFCSQLEPDALKYLKLVPKLRELCIGGCSQIEANTLKYLLFLPDLQVLGTSGCKQLSRYAKEILSFVPKLSELTIDSYDEHGFKDGYIKWWNLDIPSVREEVFARISSRSQQQ